MKTAVRQSLIVGLATLLALAWSSEPTLSEPDDHRAHTHDHPPGEFTPFPGIAPMWAQPPWDQPAGTVATYRPGRPAESHRKAKVALFRTGTLAAEPTLGVNENGTIFYVGIDLSNGIVRWPVLRSSNGGRSFKDISPTLPEGTFTHFTGQDGMLYLDKDTGRVFMTDFIGPCTPVSFTDDEGGSWTTGSACGLTDHQNLFTGPPSISQTVGYPNVVYYCAIDGGALQELSTATGCLKSLDGGRAFVRTGSPPYIDGINPAPGNFGIPGRCSGVTGHGHVDDKGTVYMPRGWCGQPWLALSHDEGATWTRIQVADNGMAFQSGGPTEYDPANATGFQEHEAGVVVDRKGTIYYFYTAMDRLPYLVVSDDGGATWGAPIMVGRPGLREASLPAIDIDDKGRIAMAYVGSTNAPGGKAPDGAGPEYAGVTWNGYVTIVDTPLRKQPVLHTASVNDPGDPLVVGECWILRCQQQYDFIDVVLDERGRAWTSIVDGCFKTSCAPQGQGILARVTVPRR